MEDDRWLKVEEVAERLGYHPDTVRRLLREGKIDGYIRNRRGGWRVRLSALDRFVTGGPETETPDAAGGPQGHRVAEE